MDNLVLANLFHRKTRTAISAAGVAIGVVLVVLTVGLTHGFLNEQGQRNSAVTAEIMVRQAGTFGIGLEKGLTVPVSIIEKIRSIEGVEAAVPIGQNLHLRRLIDGVDYVSFEKVSGVRVIEGKPISSGDEVMIDSVLQQNKKLKVGGQIDVFDRPFRIVGVYEPESLGRLKVPLSTLQDQLHGAGLCSMILVKVKDPSQQEEVAANIKSLLPDYGILLTRDLPNLYSRGTPALQTFLQVVLALSIVISSLVILLAMYTTVTERTRQIGILKSLGASSFWIASEVEKEAMMISIIGIIAGFGLSVAGKYFIQKLTSLHVELEAIWLLYAMGISIVSAVLGALYPALRAANQDPVKALAYE